MTDPSGIEVSPALFGPSPNHPGYPDTSLFVRTSAVDQAAAALRAASERIMCVGASGQEYADEDEAYGTDETPSYVSDVETHPDGVSVVVDSEEMTRPMAETIIRIVVGELSSAGVPRATLLPLPR